MSDSNKNMLINVEDDETRIAIAMPIQNAVAPMSSAQSGTISVIIGIWLKLKNPVPNTAALPRRVFIAVPDAGIFNDVLRIAWDA